MQNLKIAHQIVFEVKTFFYKKNKNTVGTKMIVTINNYYILICSIHQQCITILNVYYETPCIVFNKNLKRLLQFQRYANNVSSTLVTTNFAIKRRVVQTRMFPSFLSIILWSFFKANITTLLLKFKKRTHYQGILQEHCLVKILTEEKERHTYL